MAGVRARDRRDMINEHIGVAFRVIKIPFGVITWHLK